MDTCLVILSWLSVQFQKVPDVVWSGIIASILTLSGVLISNRSNTYRLKLQLEHDGKQKLEDRKATIRREVYLNAVKEAINASNCLGNSSNLDIGEENLSQKLKGYYEAAAQLMIVAEMKTTLAVTELSTMYGNLVLDITPKLFDIAQLARKAQFSQNIYADTQIEIKRILAAQTSFNESPPPKNFQIFENLQVSFKNQQKLAAEFSEESQNYFKQKLALQIQFGQFMLPELYKIADQQIKVLIAIREELKLDSDIELLMLNLKKQRETQQEKINNLIRFLEIKLTELQKAD